MFRKLRTAIVYSTMKVLTPNLYKKLKLMTTIPDNIDDMPRPMIKFIAKFNRKNLVGAEVGVSQGRNALSMFETLGLKKLYLVDPYLPYAEKGVSNNVHLEFKSIAVKLLKAKPVTWFFEESRSAVTKVFDELDFVYIDANHDYANVKEDIELWYSLTKIGGVVGGHDFRWHEEGVVKAVTEFANSRNIHLNLMYPDWWVIKE